MYKLLCLPALLAFGTTAMAQPGSLDAGFGTNGTATFLPQPTLNKMYGIAEQSDHKILLAGYGQAGPPLAMLTRLLPDGSLDPGFGVNGYASTVVGLSGSVGYAVAVQPDGKILLAGAIYNNASENFLLVRYLPDGKLDLGFSGDGFQTISFGTNNDDVARVILLQPDGKMLLVGTATNSVGSTFALARLKTDGSLDATFSGDGKATVSIGSFFTNAFAAVLQPDGKVVVAGTAKFGMSDDVALARLSSDGTLNASFGNGGKTTTDLGSDIDSGNALALRPDGSMVVAGKTGSSRDFALLRYQSNGTLDTGFGNQGIVTTDFFGFDDYANAVLLQPDGKIVCGGYAYVGTLPDFALARYQSNGALDAGFGSGGQVTTDFGNGYDYGFPMLLQADGKLLMGGYSFSSGHTAFATARYLSGLNVGVVDFSAPAISGLVAPNPVGASAVFEFETLQPGLFTLDLTDAQGRVLQTFFTEKELAAGQQAEQLSFHSDLPGGWYLLRLSEPERQLTVKVLVRQ